MSANRNPDARSLEMLDILTTHIGAPVGVYGKDLVFRYANKALADWSGHTPEQMVGMTMWEVYGEETVSRYMHYIKRALAGEPMAYERQVHDARGFYGWSTVSLMPWRDASGEVLGVVFTTMSVHDLKTAMEALRVASQRLASHVENSPLGVVEFDADLNLLHWSACAATLFGWAVEGAKRPSLASIFGENDAAPSDLRADLTRLQRGENASNHASAQHPRKDGSTLHCEWFNSALTDADGRVNSILSQVQDVSSKVQAAAHLRYIAEHDSLTGLANRSAVHSLVDRALNRARRTREIVALLFLDVDGFKAVNDTHGHGAGDEVLKIMARRISRCVRATDTVARLGGDEFVVLLEGDVEIDTAARVSERILDAMTEPFSFAGGLARAELSTPSEVKLGVSIGIATHPPLESQVDHLFRHADAAMYTAKRIGKGRAHVAALES